MLVRPSLLVLASASLAAANVYDCWDQEKLQRMQFKYSKGEGKKEQLWRKEEEVRAKVFLLCLIELGLDFCQLL